jgi:hypothetical protein
MKLHKNLIIDWTTHEFLIKHLFTFKLKKRQPFKKEKLLFLSFFVSLISIIWFAYLNKFFSDILAH